MADPLSSVDTGGICLAGLTLDLQLGLGGGPSDNLTAVFPRVVGADTVDSERHDLLLLAEGVLLALLDGLAILGPLDRRAGLSDLTAEHRVLSCHHTDVLELARHRLG